MINKVNSMYYRSCRTSYVCNKAGKVRINKVRIISMIKKDLHITMNDKKHQIYPIIRTCIQCQYTAIIKIHVVLEQESRL